MDSPLVIILICIAIVVGFVFGLIFTLVKRSRQEVVGDLQIIKDEENEKPYMYLQVSRPDILLNTGKKYVFLRVKRFKYFDKADKLTQYDSQK